VKKVVVPGCAWSTWAAGSALRHNDEAVPRSHLSLVAQPVFSQTSMFSLHRRRALQRVLSSRAYVCPLCKRNSSSAANNVTNAKAIRPKRIIFSGIQPTGIPHLGNYLGALREWVKLQDDAASTDQLFFSIVDLHAITVKQDPERLLQSKKEMFMSLLAIGLDPKKSSIFEQSKVTSHAELMWILSCNASMGYLGRMTQWKVYL
jgi:tryptophanyl-tRNA synthetase